jgi:hypothetical protein
MSIYDPRSAESYMRAVTTLPQDLDEIRQGFEALSREVKAGFASLAQALRVLPASIGSAVAEALLLSLEERRPSSPRRESRAPLNA